MCKSKIRKLNEAISEISQYNQSFSQIKFGLSKIANNSSYAYEIGDMSGFIEVINEVDNDFLTAKNALKQKIADTIVELERDLVQMEEDDAEYHAEDDEDEDDTTTGNGSTPQTNS